jgi:gluconate 2-dehydrogenase alpha chain
LGRRPHGVDPMIRTFIKAHNTGGTIMGADRATSVVSPHLQTWDAQNLFITGAPRCFRRTRATTQREL